jgi:hypothetical protein
LITPRLLALTETASAVTDSADTGTVNAPVAKTKREARIVLRFLKELIG